jgi:hypothetical protein
MGSAGKDEFISHESCAPVSGDRGEALTGEYVGRRVLIIADIWIKKRQI